jgi:hypothetical protein
MGCGATQSCKWLPNFRKQPQLVAEISCYNAIEHGVTTLHTTTHKIADCNDKWVINEIVLTSLGWDFDWFVWSHRIKHNLVERSFAKPSSIQYVQSIQTTWYVTQESVGCNRALLPNVVTEWLALVIHTREVASADLGPETIYPEFPISPSRRCCDSALNQSPATSFFIIFSVSNIK